jgi:hypothetical protein
MFTPFQSLHEAQRRRPHREHCEFRCVGIAVAAHTGQNSQSLSLSILTFCFLN